MLEILSNPLAQILAKTTLGLLIPWLLDVIIFNSLLNLQKKLHFAVVALLINLLIFVGNIVLSGPINNFLNYLMGTFFNIGTQVPANLNMIILLKNYLLPLVLLLSVLIVASIKIAAYKKMNAYLSLKDVSLAALLSVLCNSVIGSTIVFIALFLLNIF